MLGETKVPNELQTDDVMVQGDSYEEQDYFEEGTEAPVMELQPSGGSKSKKGNIIVLGTVIGVVFIGVLLVIVMVMSGGSGSSIFGGKSDEEEAPDEPEYTIVTYRGQDIRVPIDPVTGEPIVPYTAEELEQLRQVGYTGYEIEEFQAQEIEPEQLIQDAEQAQQEWVEQYYAPYFDTASEEWKSVINSTWYGLEEVESYDTDSLMYSYYNYTLNADYEKIPAYGHQLYLKVYLNESGDYAFMICTPERYAELADSGNIVVSIDYTETLDGHKFITSIVENRVD